MPGKQSKAVIGLFIGLMIAGILLAPMSSAISNNTGEQNVVNESVTADTSEYVDLEGWDLVSGSETVYWLNESSGDYEVVTAPGDYTLREQEGQIRANSSGPISTGDSLKVTYDYMATSGTTTTIAGFLMTIIVVMLVWFPAKWVMDYA